MLMEARVEILGPAGQKHDCVCSVFSTLLHFQEHLHLYTGAERTQNIFDKQYSQYCYSDQQFLAIGKLTWGP